jgi:malonyl-CoA decarboxylase
MGIALARTILEKYASLTAAERLDFLQFLNENLELDADTVSQIVVKYRASGALDDYEALTASAEPPR